MSATHRHDLEPSPARPTRLRSDPERRRKLVALGAAVLVHAVALVALAQPAAIKLGVANQVDPVTIRWVAAPVVPSPGLARSEPPPPTEAKPEAPPPVKPKPRPARQKPKPRPALQDERVVAAAAAQPASQSASDALVASPLPQGQDPLTMLHTTPEHFQMLDALSRQIAEDPAMYEPGNAVSLSLDVDGQPRVWRFVIVAEEAIQSLSGLDVPTLRLMHFPEHDQDPKLEVWLVPQLAYRPVQIALTPPGALSAQLHNARSALDQLDPRARGSAAPAQPDSAAPSPQDAASR